MPKVYRYRVYDVTRDDYVTSTRMATKKKIEQIRGEILSGTEAKIDDELLKDGWTEKDFKPKPV